MLRTQIQITEAQAAQLRRLAAERNQSVAEVIRTSVDYFMRAHAGTADRVEKAKRLAGRFSSGSSDGSTEHDRHLADAFGNL